MVGPPTPAHKQRFLHRGDETQVNIAGQATGLAFPHKYTTFCRSFSAP